MKQPDVYKGRYVLIRGALDDLKVDGGKTTALLLETSLRATAREVDVGTRYRTERTESFSGQGELRSTRLGNASAIEKLTVHWPEGRNEQFTVPALNQYTTLIEGAGQKAQ